MASDRKLASVLFADIVGFTSMMGRDESSAKKAVDHFKSVCQPIVAHHGGTWLKDLGDGVLCSFGSSLAAVRCSIAMQKSLIGASFKVRIGIHLGDITFSEGDVLGDGVNVASRVQGAAEPGTIFISDPIYRTVSNHPEIEAVRVGRRKLKNVKQPLILYQIVVPGMDRRIKRSGLKRLYTQLGLFLGGLIFGASIVFWVKSANQNSQQSLRFTVQLPVGYELKSRPVISSDGSILAFAATGFRDTAQIFIQRLNAFSQVSLTATQSLDTETPFFSPDGRWVAFYREGKIQKLSLETGAILTICEYPARTLHSAYWRADDSIFLASAFYGLSRVWAHGGIPLPITEPSSDRNEVSYVDPGRGRAKDELFLTVNTTEGPKISFISATTSRPQTVIENAMRSRATIKETNLI
jgi:class 3 adenylate cyclase